LLAFGAASALASALSALGLFKWPDVNDHGIRGWPADYVILLITALILWAMVATYSGIHKVDRIESAQRSYWRLVRALLAWLSTTAISIFFLKLQLLSRQFNLSFFGISSCLILIRHSIDRAVVSLRSSTRRSCRSAIIIGHPRESQWLVNALSASPEWYGSVTQAEFQEVKDILNGVIVTESTMRFDEASEIFILPGVADQKQIEDWELRLLRTGRTVHVIPAIIDAQLFRQNLGDISGVPTLTLETGTPGELEGALKRIADVAIALIILVGLGPIMAFIALLIKITSPGPALFTQKRLGKAGKPFKIFKFRSMRTDAEDLLKHDGELRRKYLENNYKVPATEDVRVTRLGRLLRKTSIDELPQLFNVLRGEMSLVGPRPILPEELEKYGEYSSLLLMVKPGMTGSWQVSGRSRIAEYSDRVKLDMEYVRDQSITADLGILIRTVGAVTRMDGAH
jgi:exopolysaccharide biosynthesis polyprenyl glycosylphosphotransferase